jgi:hypothetical protein
MREMAAIKNGLCPLLRVQAVFVVEVTEIVPRP